MDLYHRRRLVSWIAFHANKGRTWEDICARNAARRDGHPQEEMDACREAGYQAVRNAELVALELQRRRLARKVARDAGQPAPAFPPLRLCDLDGCRFTE